MTTSLPTRRPGLAPVVVTNLHEKPPPIPKITDCAKNRGRLRSGVGSKLPPVKSYEIKVAEINDEA